MTEVAVTGRVSLFDAIRHVDEYGEHWFGRDLMVLMAYARWHEFATVIEKARASLALVQGAEQADHHFVIQHSDGGRWGTQRLTDYRLSRFGAYLVAMAGDDTKERVAEARIYFAVKSREAEVRQELDELEVARRYVVALEEKKRLQVERDQLWHQASAQSEVIAIQTKELTSARPKAEFVDGVVNPRSDATTVRNAIPQLCEMTGQDIRERKLFAWLKQRRLLYQDKYGQWLPAAGPRRNWFVTCPQLEAPRLHNDQFRQTTYVTAPGLVGIANLLTRYPLQEAAGDER